MRYLKTFCTLWLFLSFTATVTQAQELDHFNMNELETASKIKGTATGKIYHDINYQVFDNSDLREGDTFRFEFEDNSGKNYTITKKREYLPGVISILAREEGKSDRVFMATYSEGRLIGKIYESHDKVYNLSFDVEADRNYITDAGNVETSDLLCSLSESEITPNNFVTSLSGQQKKKKLKTSYSPAPMYASTEDSVTIDLIMAYTDAAEEWASTSSAGDIDVVLAEAMIEAQAVLDNSNSKIGLRLVHVYKTDYTDDDSEVSGGDHLKRFTQNPDDPIFDSSYDGYMEEVHDLREQYGADLAALILSEPNTGGIAWRLSDTNGAPGFGFSVNRVQQTNLGYTLIHEIGHNMGSVHSRTQNSQEAGGQGGIFHYSAGYQNTEEDFHTIMAYSDGLQQAPLFSSPDLTFNGVPAGTNDSETPENNAESIKQLKRSISKYLPTKVDSPVAEISTSSIEVEMNREDNLTVPVDISNNGISSLVWDVDFSFPVQQLKSSVVSAQGKEGSNNIKPVFIEDAIRNPSNFSETLSSMKSKFQEEVLYSTSFETEDGFKNGAYEGLNGWQGLNTSFNITTQNPKSGDRNFRIVYTNNGNTQFVAAPFFGYQLFGNYEVSLDFYLGGDDAGSETFDFYFFDGKNGEFSSAVIISSGNLLTAFLNEQNSLSFKNAGSVPLQTYNNLKIVYNNTDEVIEYYLNGDLVSSDGYVGGFTPGLLQVLHRNEVSGTYIDVDDIEIKQLSTPYDWLNIDVDDMTGVTNENQSSQIALNFSTVDISAGTYETTMKISTNDPDNPEIEIPITLTVNEATSNEVETIPNKVALNQNYPNPFNPVTTITYTLKTAGIVSLEVYNIQGQKVATLLSNKKVEVGEHEIDFNASNLSSGVYIYRLDTGGQLLTRKMVLVK